MNKRKANRKLKLKGWGRGCTKTNKLYYFDKPKRNGLAV